MTPAIFHRKFIFCIKKLICISSTLIANAEQLRFESCVSGENYEWTTTSISVGLSNKAKTSGRQRYSGQLNS